MTNEEAIDLLKSDIHTEIPRSAIGARRHNEAILAAIEALKKQIPKKPEMYDARGLYEVARCSCGSHDVLNWCGCQRRFCPDCGQAIDWSEVEE